MKKALKIRKNVKHIPGAWVRVYKDGTIWAGAKHHIDTPLVKEALEDAGYRCELNGKPATAGEYIIDVFEV